MIRAWREEDTHTHTHLFQEEISKLCCSAVWVAPILFTANDNLIHLSLESPRDNKWCWQDSCHFPLTNIDKLKLLQSRSPPFSTGTLEIPLSHTVHRTQQKLQCASLLTSLKSSWNNCFIHFICSSTYSAYIFIQNWWKFHPSTMLYNQVTFFKFPYISQSVNHISSANVPIKHNLLGGRYGATNLLKVSLIDKIYNCS